jgi:hypothetical protein
VPDQAPLALKRGLRKRLKAKRARDPVVQTRSIEYAIEPMVRLTSARP